MMYYRFSGIPIAATALTLLAQPGWAAPTQVTAIQLKPTTKGIELTLNTQGDRPPVFTASRGKSTVADITNSQLRLPGSKSWRQNNPAPGITSVVVSQIEANTVRAVVNGSSTAPIGRVRRSGPGVTLNFDPITVAQTQTPARPQTSSPKPTPNLVPPLLPRAVAPPVGDISVAPLELKPDTVDLGTSERIPKLLLREAPVQEVLTLLARAAGVNLIYIPPGGTPAQPVNPPTQPGAVPAQPGGATPALPGTAPQPLIPPASTPSNTQGVILPAQNISSTGSSLFQAATSPEPARQADTISLDIEDEPIQDVFNYVLQVTGLQANRVGNTIFVGRNLPGAAQNRVVRTYRLNQIKATASGTITQELISKAETGGSVTAAKGNQVGEEANIDPGVTAETAINRTTTSNRTINDRGAKEILESYGANGGGTGAGSAATSGPSSTLLRGLEVVSDARANTVTLIGSPNLVEAGASLLTQIDSRRRQAAVNVKIVDVDLTKGRNANADLAFNSTNTIASGFINGVFRIGAVLGNDFLLNLITSIQDRSAKILTDPTLVVQEGSSAQVNLTQEIFSGIERKTTAVGTTGALPTITESPILRPAGVILNMTVDQIDDNGFITLNISPEISTPSGTFALTGGLTGTLLQQRRLETGQVRLRDGQTLILTGIIQDQDRTDTSKVPILGDIPLLGRLFRREAKTRQRQEVVVIVTPHIMDDSDQAKYGYQYNPSPEAEKLLRPKR